VICPIMANVRRDMSALAMIDVTHGVGEAGPARGGQPGGEASREAASREGTRVLAEVPAEASGWRPRVHLLAA
jgi:hypothetical protein